MSWVWTVMLSLNDEEFWEEGADGPSDTCQPLKRVNASIAHGRLVSLVGPTYARGAGYGMQARLYGGGFKHFDIDRFITVVQSQKWKESADVQLWVKADDAESFTQIKLRRGPNCPKRKPGPTRTRKSGTLSRMTHKNARD